MYIIDEHKEAREILARRLASLPDLQVVGATGDAAEGLLRIQALHPDVVLLDIKMNRANGVEVCRRASSTDGVRVAILTSYIDAEERRNAKKAGARSYLLKDADTRKLVLNIRRLLTDRDGPSPEDGKEV